MPALTCSGPVHETDGAGWFCPLDLTADPEDWDEHCARCQAKRDAWEELGADCERDERSDL